jgi:hypothetical protein
MFLRNVGLLSTDYNGVISQNTELFITTAVRTPNPTDILNCSHEAHNNDVRYSIPNCETTELS